MSFTAWRTLSAFFSNTNSGVCTPITTSPCFLYFASQARTYGSWRRQLMHVYVQKSIKTTFPCRSAFFNGSELSHPVAPSREGKGSLNIDPSAKPAAPNWQAAIVIPAVRRNRRRSWLMASDICFLRLHDELSQCTDLFPVS